MAGAHSRSSRHERPDPAEIPAPPAPDLDGLDRDRDYGEIFRPRPAHDPAPPSPPVGIPTASASRGASAPAAPAAPAASQRRGGGTGTLTGSRPARGAGTSSTALQQPPTVPPPPPVRSGSDGPTGRGPAPSAPRPVGHPSFPGSEPAPAWLARPQAVPGARTDSGPQARPGHRPPAGPPRTGAPVRPGAPARPAAPAPQVPAPAGPRGASAPAPPRPTGPARPGTSRAPLAPGAPAGPGPHAPVAPAGRAAPPAPPKAPNAPAGPTRPAPPSGPRPANLAPTATGGRVADAPPAPERTPDGTAIAPAVGKDPAAKPPTAENETTTAEPTRAASGTTTSTATTTRRGGSTPQSMQTRAERRAAGKGGLARAAGRRTTTPGRTRITPSEAPDRDERPAPPRGRIAAAVAVLVAAVAAKVVHWPGGEFLVRVGHRIDDRVQRYLDGKDAASLPVAARLWRRRRRMGYAMLATAVGVPALALTLGFLLIPVPNAETAVESQLNTVAFSDGSVLARVAPGEQGNRQKVAITQVPPAVQHAVLSAEDRTFYTNSGFDVSGIAKAAWKQVTGGAGGGSTITQQYVKNAMVGSEHSYLRKFKELIISAKITQEYSKDQVLEDYLNSIYLGRGAYGIQAASQAYFGKTVDRLSPAEGAMIAGLIQAPSQWDPAVNRDGSQRRWNYVLDGMVTSGWLSPGDRAAATFPATVPPRKVGNGVPDDDRGHIYNAVKDELQSLGIDEDALVTEGLQIQTTIDPGKQQDAVDAVRQEMKGKPGNLRTAAVSVDPRTGAILAYYGGDNGSGLDYAQVQKQAGSTFKPFVMSAALQHNPPIGISTQFDGQSVAGKTVRNVEGADCSNCSLKRAMTLSNNVVFTALGNEVGAQAVADAAHQAGISAPLANPNSGLALGNAEVTPVEMAGAYATFANDGVYHKPHLVQKVTTASGEVLYDGAADQGEQRIDPKVARNVTEAMRDVPTYDGAQLAGGRLSAGKTGTVQSHLDNQNNDAWMVGYTPSVVASVWVGTDDNTPIQYLDGRPVYGHGIPSDIWQNFMNGAAQGTPKQSFGEFVPVTGTDPGTTATGEGQQAGTTTTASSPTTATRTPGPTTTSSSATPSAGPAPEPAPAEPAAPATTQAPAAPQPEAPAQQPADGG